MQDVLSFFIKGVAIQICIYTHGIQLDKTSQTNSIHEGPAGEIGLGSADTEWDYREFTLAFPTIKYPGSYAFTVLMWNGVSE